MPHAQVVLQLVFQLTREPSRSDADRAATQFRVLSDLLLALFLCYGGLALSRALCMLCWRSGRSFSTWLSVGDGIGKASDEAAGDGYRLFADEARAGAIPNTVLRR